MGDKHQGCHEEMSLSSDTDMSSKETQSQSGHAEISVEVCSMFCSTVTTMVPVDLLIQETDPAVIKAFESLQFYLPDYSSPLFKPPRFSG